MKKLLSIAALAAVIVLLLFDVDVNPRMSLPGETEAIDPEQEARYEACVEEQDRIVHGETFAAIDNPDVQREVLTTRKSEAKRECRERYPERTTVVEVPFEFNIVDLEFRY